MVKQGGDYKKILYGYVYIIKKKMEKNRKMKYSGPLHCYLPSSKAPVDYEDKIWLLSKASFRVHIKEENLQGSGNTIFCHVSVLGT